MRHNTPNARFRPGNLAGPMAERITATGETPSVYLRCVVAATDSGSVATNCYARSRGHWPAGKRRNKINAQRFIVAMVAEFSAREVARMADVSDRTIRRWASGEDWATEDSCHKIVAALFRDAPQSSLPLYAHDMAIDGNTRCGGVGEYTLRAARPQVRKTYDTLRLIVRSGCVSAFME